MKLLEADGALRVEAAGYRLLVRPGSSTATLGDASGRPWAELRLNASLDTLDGLDETHGLSGPDVEAGSDEIRLTWGLASSRWRSKVLCLVAREHDLSVALEVDGEGRITELTLLGGRAMEAYRASGTFWSRPHFASLFNAAPSDPARVVLGANSSTDITVVSDSAPGRGQWFFTPAPFLFAVNREPAIDPTALPGGEWLTFALDCAADGQRFTGFGYRAADAGFRFVLDYEGHTAVRGSWSSPRLVIAPATDPYNGLRLLRGRALAMGRLPERSGSATPRWWNQPMFCGWGAQCAEAVAGGSSLAAAASHSTQANYDRWLAHLDERGVVPGTVVIDDKWQRQYATNEPDESKWPDLRGWIADRHARGQRVLLWWKAWDAEGMPPGWCVRTPNGDVLTVDPNHPAARDAVGTSIRRMLGADGLHADGLKIDFTARTPSGSSLEHHPGTWGVDLLRTLLGVVRDAAKEANPECLLVGQVVEPSLAPLVDMVRLNDLLRLDDDMQPGSIVPQMEYRAAVARAANPDHLIDTDDWCAVDLADWRRYTARKPALGVPALYYVTGLDRTGERFEAADYELLATTWREYRGRMGLSHPAAGPTQV